MKLSLKLLTAIIVIFTFFADSMAYRPVTRDELSNLSVRAVTEDARGCIWIATANGLCKRYGNEYRIYFGNLTDDTTVPSNAITDLFKDREGTLFVATDIGIVGLDDGSRIFRRYTPDSEQKHFAAYGFIEYAGRLFCYGDDGLYEISKADGTLTHRVKTEGQQITSATVGPDRKLWLSNGTALTAVDSTLKIASRMGFDPSDRVNTMTTVGNRILLGTQHGISELDPVSQGVTPTVLTRKAEVNRILRIAPNILLLATGNIGVIAYDRATGNTSHAYGNIDFSSLGSTEIKNIYRDRNNNIWVSTFDRGEFVMSGQHGLFNADRVRTDALRDDFVTRATTDSYGNLWTGTRAHGIAVLPANSARPVYLNSSNVPDLRAYLHDFVQELAFDSEGRLWAGYNNYIIVCRPKYNAAGNPTGIEVIKTFPFFVDAVSFAEDPYKRVWVGTGNNGLFIFDRELNTIRNITTPLVKQNNITRSIPYDSQHMLISAFSDNLYLVDINTFSLQTFHVSDTRAAQNAIDLLLDEGKNLWIGTYRHGLFRVDAKTKQAMPCLPDDTYADIVALAVGASGDIWGSSSYGIYRFTPDGKLRNMFTRSNGLGGNQFHEKCVTTLADGSIIFGGNSGIDQVAPSLNRVDPIGTKIPLMLRNFSIMSDRENRIVDQIGDRDISDVSNITLAHNDNSIIIDFFGADYTPSSNIEYAYQLEGLDKDFIFSDSHTRASYSNLDPGEYSFYVKARRKGHEWQQPVKLMDIKVKPNPWFSVPARIAYILIFLSIIIFANWFYLHYKLIKQKFSLSEERMRHEKEVQKNRVQFFTNISHELRTPLTLICGPAKQLSKSHRDMTPEQIDQSLGFINGNIERLLTLIDQLLSFRRVNTETLPLKVTHADLSAQLQALAKLYGGYASEHNLNVELVIPEDAEASDLVYDTDKVEKIVSNLMVNAVKYSKDKGTIHMSLELLDKPAVTGLDPNLTYASITIADEGKGVDDEDIPKIFLPFKRILKLDNAKTEGYGIGLNFVKHLVKEHRGILRTSRNEKGGMTFTIILPVSEEAFQPSEFKELEAQVRPSDDSVTRNASEATSETPAAEAETPVADTETTVTEADAIVTDEETDVIEMEEEEEPALPKLLIVEDNEPLNTFIASLFVDSYSVSQASDGSTGLQIAMEETPDIIISDIKMPGEIDGYTLCREIKQNPSTSHLPVVLLTAKTLDENKIYGYECGADAYLCKPFSPDVLIACVNNLATKRQQTASMVLATAGHTADGETPIAATQEPDLSPLDKRFLEKLYAYLESNLDNSELNVNMLGRELGFSRTNFYRKVKALTGVSPTDLLRVYRLNRAAELLLSREFTVGEVAEKIGFVSQSHFSSLFRKHFGVSPRAYVAEHFPQYTPN